MVTILVQPQIDIVPSSTLRNAPPFMLPVLVSGLIVAAGLLLASGVAHHHLADEARSAAARWVETLRNDLALDRLLATGEVRDRDLEVLALATSLSLVSGFVVRDRDGRVILRSDPHDAPGPEGATRDTGIEIPAVPARGTRVVELLERRLDRQPGRHAVVEVPVTNGSGFAGTAEVEVDLAEPAAGYWRTAGAAIVALAIVLALATVLPVGSLWRGLEGLRRAEAEIRHAAHHDPLTGLPNRSLCRIRLDEALRRGATVLLCLDLDRFKPVNERLGEAAGDRLLVEVAERLRRSVRAGDTIARLGGDEFAVVLSGVDDARAAEGLAARILRVMALPIQLGDEKVEAGCSIGIAFAGHAGGSADQLLREAGVALQEAKADVSSSYRLYTADMTARCDARRTLEADLRQALAEGQFRLHFQPIFAMPGARLTGFEALLRWQHPRLGTVAPDQFIPLAEETGLIVPIGAWVLREACRIAAGWPDDIRISVNLSTAQFSRREPAEMIARVLEESGLEPARLDLEVTENLVLRDVPETLDNLIRIKALGVRLSLDDFGTGYSSLSYLTRFPIDRIKIDQSFVRRIEDDPDVRAIVAAVIRLGHRLGMIVTAEGVERGRQLEILASEGCDEVQGFHLGRPADPVAAAALIDRPGVLEVRVA
ncbi:MAG TPA: bifunctional diguanylate cyclase/phosphodiesterase [Geminicoccaceae bacterium]